MIQELQSYIESLVFRLAIAESNDEDWFNQLLNAGAEAALAKVQATKTFELCAREAAHLHGGNSYVQDGNRVESLYRDVLSLAIPGGAEDIMVDSAARQSLLGKL